ncbi:MAG TPA: class II fructose-bisphosphate aldolase [Anaerolineaceae bacterium]|nr:class II fructose-bisphosphate aldolase [Anaerolineaceae bacterium]
MKFLTMTEILSPCLGQDWAVGAYDTCNLETTQAIVDAAAADQAPVLIMVLPHHTPRAEWPTLVRMITSEMERTGIPAGLVLDHAKTLDQIESALALGFSGVMIDASLAPLEENIAITRRAVELAHAAGASVEAELGHVGGGENETRDDLSESHFTRVDEAERFVRETGVDALAVSIGTVHGLYRGTPKLDFERLAQIRAACPIPLVLHGGSDTPDPDLRRAIELGIEKINVWTDVRIPFLRAMQARLAGPVEKTEVFEVSAAAREAAYAVIRRKNQLFGSAGKAGLYPSWRQWR